MTDRFTEARQRLGEEIGESGIAVIPSSTELIRSNDVSFDFHQDPNFLYLTGLNEPDAVAVIAPGHPDGEFLLFVRPRDPEQEAWTGYRAGVEGAKERFQADAAYDTAKLEEILARHMVGREVLWYAAGNDRYDGKITSILGKARRLRSYLGAIVPSSVRDLTVVLDEMRLIKTHEEQELLKEVCRLSAEGHLEAMRFASPGMYEYQVQHAMEYVWRQRGSRHNGYPSIVASGPNACILHYVRNDRQISDGDLVLIDAAAELEGYSSDITRTFPVNGGFTGPQRALYEVVLEAERTGIELATPGSSMMTIRDAAARVLTEGLVALGLLPLSLEESLAMHHYREFFFHGIGHWLGLDVHDTGRVRLDGKPRPLEPGMSFTVEPGLYISPEKGEVELTLLEYDLDSWTERRIQIGAASAAALEAEERESAEKISHTVPSEFLGLGVRIEDDVLITMEGNQNLTASVPVAIDEVEAICAERPRLPRP